MLETVHRQGLRLTLDESFYDEEGAIPFDFRPKKLCLEYRPTLQISLVM